MELIKKICQSYTEIAFPPACVCCGTSTNSEDRFICSLCRTERFEEAGNAQQDVLPETVRFLYTMWYFDKGGYLQDLLHQLKYHFMRGIGFELGYVLGKHFLDETAQEQLEQIGKMNPVIVPVPLHPSKKRKRGYNQARVLGEGLAKSAGWDLLDEGVVERIGKTKTQTGLNVQQRSENLHEAFQIKNGEILKDRFSILIDDVFTTGATTFELAKAVHAINQQPSGILTVAKA